MKSKSQVLALVKKMNVEMDEKSTGFKYDVTFWADKEFSASSAKCLVISWFDCGNKNEFWQECYNELNMGFDDYEC